MRNRILAGFAAVALLFTLLTGCGAPDKRITLGITTVQHGLEVDARNTDRIWTAFISQYRDAEMVKIDGFYTADQKKAVANKPARAAFNSTEEYADALVQYASDSTTFLQRSEAIRKRNVDKLNDKIAGAQTAYDATKRNREAYSKLVQTLAEYEDAKIDPSAVAPIIQQLVTAFMPVDNKPKK